MKTLFTLLFSAILSSCSLLSIDPLDERARTLEQQSNWHVQGKVSLRNSQESATGLLDWKQHGDSYEIVISGPFGQGTTRLEGSSSQAKLMLPNSPPYQSENAEELMQEILGWSFPVTDLTYWVKGIPAPATVNDLEQDEYGLITRMKQHQWDIQLKRYSIQAGSWLPGLIKLQGHDQSITLAVNRWSFND